MVFWITTAAISVAAILILLRAFLRGVSETTPTEAYDVQVYRDQLQELERDEARGVLSPQDAERARAEVSRRLIEADRALQAAQEAGTGLTNGKVLIPVGLVATLAFAVLVYVQLGVPNYPDMPITTRIERIEENRATRPSQAEAVAEASVSARPAIPENPELEALVERLRAIMTERRDDPTGWRLLAENELRLGNFEAAVAAQEQLVGLLAPESPEGVAARANLAEMMILAAGGYVSPEAEAVLTETIAQEPRNGTARYYMGLMYAQGGRPDLAYTIWRTLLAESTSDAPWLEPIRLQIEEVAFLAGDPINVDDLPQPRREDAPLRGPEAAQMEAAAQMSAEDRAAMIEGMVGNLSARLANEGGTVEEYAQLITALGVLGRLDEARTILAEARANFAGQDGAATVLDTAEAGLSQ